MPTPFGGVTYDFKGQKATMEQVFGKEPINPTEMTQKIWAFIKANPHIKKGGK